MKKFMTTTAALGALTFFSVASDAAIKKPITFMSNGERLVGDLYLPDTYEKGDKLPAVVVSGSWTSVKDQMAGGYAKEMADRGYAALAFDFAGWGESSGDLRFVEDPAAKTRDIISAAEFLTTQPEVDAVRIATLGICASAGYATDAALISQTIKAAAVVAPWYHDADIVNQVYGDNVGPLINASKEAEQKFKSTGESTLLPAASENDTTAVMQGEGYYTDKSRGAIPSYDNKFNVMTWEPWLTYDAIKTAKKLKKPTLLVHSESAAVPQGAKKYLEKAGSNARGVWIDNITQFDFYDDKGAMKKASDEVAYHFKTNLQNRSHQ